MRSRCSISAIASILCLYALSGCSFEYGFANQVPLVQEPTEDEQTDTALPEAAEDTAEPEGVYNEDPAPTFEDSGMDFDMDWDTIPPAPADDCTFTSDLIYVLSKDNEHIYTYDPTTGALDDQGQVDCGMYGTPASMAVSRSGIAYVRYSDNALYQVDLETMSCSPTSYQPGAFGSFGMGFATLHANTWQDELYIANHDRLAELSTTSWQRSLRGNMSSQAEITGNANGDLWAVLPLESPAELVQLDKTSGAVTSSLPLPGFPNPFNIDTFALAAWGGDLYVFVRTYGLGSSTDVLQVSPNGAMQVIDTNIGISVVGAGASTCAPW